MTRRFGLGVVAAAVLAGCGPSVPINTDVHQAGVNVLYGIPTPSPLPEAPTIIQVNPIQSFPTPVEAPPIVPVFNPPPNPCPDLSPLSYPAEDASPTSIHPPTPGTYPFRHTGSLTTNPGTSTQKVVNLPETGTREVTNVKAVAADQSYTFDVVDTYNGIATTTSYKVYPVGVGGQLPASNGIAPGVYITQVTTTQPNFGPLTFAPEAPGVEIFSFPASSGVTWQSAGTDPIDATTEVIGPTQSNPQGTATVGDDVRVNACGNPIAAWQATMQGEEEYGRGGPNTTATFTLTVDMATQYGALIVGDSFSEQYTATDGTPTQYFVQSTINVVPNPPSS